MLYHLPLLFLVISAEASPIHRQISICSPLLGRVESEFRRPHRHALLSMNEGRFVGEEQPVPKRMQVLFVVALDIVSRLLGFQRRTAGRTCTMTPKSGKG